MVHSNLHAHTTFCDGRNTPREMVSAAVAKGFRAVGFSGHAWTPFDPSYCMTPEGTQDYLHELRRLRDDFAGVIEVYAGIEQDYFSPAPEGPFDYKLGAVHYLLADGDYLPIDESTEDCCAQVERYFGGDWFAWTAAYYRLVAELAEQTGADIIAHFDLCTKYNECNVLFNEADERYRRAVDRALAPLLMAGKLFEVNTGAMARGLRSTPYPAPFILRRIRDGGGRIVLASDSHDVFSLDFAFDDAARYARACGFETACVLTPTGFTEVEL